MKLLSLFGLVTLAEIALFMIIDRGFPMAPTIFSFAGESRAFVWLPIVVGLLYWKRYGIRHSQGLAALAMLAGLGVGLLAILLVKCGGLQVCV